MKKFIIALLALVFTAYPLTVRVWNGTSSDMNAEANYNGGTGAPGVGDSLLFDATATAAATASAALSVGAVKIAAAYSGNWSMATYDLTCAQGFSTAGTGTITFTSDTLTCNGASATVQWGSGIATSNLSTLTLNLAGGTAMVYKDDKYMTFKRIYVNGKITSSGSGGTTITGACPLMTFGSGGTWTNSPGDYLILKPTASGALFSLPASYTITTNTGIKTYGGTGAILDTIPAITITGTSADNYFNNTSASAATKIYLSGMLNNSTNNIHFANVSSTASRPYLFNTLGNDIKTGNFSWGCGGNQPCSLITTGSKISMANYNSTSYNTAGAVAVWYMGAGNFDTCTGAWTERSNHTIDCQTSKIIFKPSTGNTFTSAGKLYYDIQKTGTSKIIQADLVVCHDLTIDQGQWDFNNKNDTIHNDFTRTTTDTVFRTSSTLYIGRHHISTGSGAIIGDGASFIEYYGLKNTHNITGGTNRIGILRGIDSGHVFLLANMWSNLYNDSTGDLNTNGYRLTIDSLFKAGDSINTAFGDTIQDSGSVIVKSTSRLSAMKGVFKFIGNKAVTWYGGGNAKSLGRVHINKGANSVTTSGVTASDSLWLDNGTLTLGDTAYTGYLSITTTVAQTLAKPIVVSGGINIAAGANITYSGTGKIINTTCTLATLNGNSVKISYPAIGPVTYSGSPFTWTVGTSVGTISPAISGCNVIDSVVKAAAWPGGTTINRATGVITGTPTGALSTAGYKIYFWSWTNGAAYKDSTTVTITVNAAPVTSRRRRGALNCGLLISTD